MVLRGNTFEEIAEQIEKHSREMFEKKDGDHLKAMQEMGKLMQKPIDMMNWMNKKRKRLTLLLKSINNT